jgi:hypothetical protein
MLRQRNRFWYASCSISRVFVKLVSLLTNVRIEEQCMPELSKSAKLRMLILGLMLVKLALLLFFYHPVFGLSSPPSTTPQDTTSPARARAQRPEVGGATAGSTDTPGRKEPSGESVDLYGTNASGSPQRATGEEGVGVAWQRMSKQTARILGRPTTLGAHLSWCSWC